MRNWSRPFYDCGNSGVIAHFAYRYSGDRKSGVGFVSWGFAKQILPLLAIGVSSSGASCWDPRTMAQPLPESFQTVGLSKAVEAIRFSFNFLATSSVHSCILPRLPGEYRLFKVCWLREWAKVGGGACCLRDLPVTTQHARHSGRVRRNRKKTIVYVGLVIVMQQFQDIFSGMLS